MTTKNKALKKLAQKHAVGGPPVGDEFTVKEWEDETGVSQSRAHQQLSQMVARGEITKRFGRVGSRRTNIYKPA